MVLNFPMILGIGSDIVDIRRIEHSCNRFGSRFLNRIYTANEIKNSQARVYACKYLASRFAAKEALVKALGCGIVANGVSWQDIEINNNENGKPVVSLSGEALRYLQKITPAGYQAKIDISLSDEHPYAQAFVIVSVITIKEE